MRNICGAKWSFSDTIAINAIHDLSVFYFNQGRIKEAGAILQRALEGKEKVLRPDYTLTLDIVYNLGTLYINQGKLEEAEELLQRALEGKKKVLGPDHISTLNSQLCQS